MIGKMEVPFLPLIHQISNTANYAIIMLCPIAMSMMNFLTNGFHPIDSYRRVPDEPTKFFLMDLRNGSIIEGFETFDPSLLFSVHHINAFQEDDEVILDIVASKWEHMTTLFDVDHMLNWEEKNKEIEVGNMNRIRLNIRSKELTVQKFDNLLPASSIKEFDFPILNPSYFGQNYRFVYGWSEVDYWNNTLIKKDLQDSTGDKTWAAPSNYPGEPFFVSNPGGLSEDDGILITIVFDGILKQSYLLLLDGITFKEINRAYLPHVVPYSFHGNWFPNLL